MTDPSLIAGGPAFWLKADALTGLVDTDPISTWTDSSTGGNNATGTLTERPLYRTAQLNSLPIGRFDVSAPGLKMVSNASSSGAEQTIIAVFKAATLASRSTMRGGRGGTGGLQLRTSTGTSGALELVNEGVAIIGTGTTSIGTSAFRVCTATFSDSGNAYAFYLDGTAVGSGATAASLTAGRTTTLGQSNAGSDPTAGDLAELICWNSVLSAGDRAAAHSYLQDKYGITVSDYVAAGTNAPAGNATGTGAAQDATSSLAPNAEQPTGTAAAQAASAAVAPNAEAPSVAGTALDATAALAVNAEAPAGTGTAFDATVTVSSSTNAPAGAATGTGTASDASVSVTVAAEVPAAASAVLDASVALVAAVEAAFATGVAYGATVTIGGGTPLDYIVHRPVTGTVGRPSAGTITRPRTYA